MPAKLKFAKFAALYCASQVQTPKGLREVLKSQVAKFKPDGFMILRCQQMDSSRFGDRVIVAYGPNNTFKVPPDFPISPRGLASDMSTVEAIMDATEVEDGTDK